MGALLSKVVLRSSSSPLSAVVLVVAVSTSAVALVVAVSTSAVVVVPPGDGGPPDPPDRPRPALLDEDDPAALLDNFFIRFSTKSAEPLPSKEDSMQTMRAARDTGMGVSSWRSVSSDIMW